MVEKKIKLMAVAAVSLTALGMYILSGMTATHIILGYGVNACAAILYRIVGKNVDN